ncbi:MAG: HEAT repeat domain-containing protein [Armatimonadetes bacterium]|nr:HEAT repeat domain-containing protein [Armatimonadota bacterium]
MNMGLANDDRTVSQLVGYLYGPEAPSKVRCSTALVLGYARNDLAVRPLAQLLKDEDAEVRNPASEALLRLGVYPLQIGAAPLQIQCQAVEVAKEGLAQVSLQMVNADESVLAVRMVPEVFRLKLTPQGGATSLFFDKDRGLNPMPMSEEIVTLEVGKPLMLTIHVFPIVSHKRERFIPQGNYTGILTYQNYRIRKSTVNGKEATAPIGSWQSNEFNLTVK